MSTKQFIPVTSEDQMWGEGDWRPLLGKGPRKSEVKVHMIGANSIKEHLTGAIMPSHDYYGMSTDDEAFGASTHPCWTNTPDAHLPAHFEPSAWAMPFIMYPYLGPKNEHFMSPANRANMLGNESVTADQLADAFDDLNKWVRRNKAYSDADKEFFLRRPDQRTDARIPGRSSRFVSLAYARTREEGYHTAVLVYTGSAHSYMLAQMRVLNERDAAPRDPNYQRYLLGDVTAPDSALEFHADKMFIDAKDAQATNCILFSDHREILDDPQKVIQIPAEALANRFLLADPDNWNIPTYEEQVQYMVENYDEDVTSEMIRAACGHRCEVPDRRRVTTVSTAPTAGSKRDETVHTSDPMAAVTGALPAQSDFAPQKPPVDAAPTPPPAPPVDAAPTPAPPVDPPTDTSTVYWSGPRGDQNPVQRTAAQLSELFNAGKSSNLMVNVEGATWVSIAECGLFPVSPAAPAPPAVPAADAPPAVPAAAVVASVPGSAVAEFAEAKIKLRRNLFPDDAVFMSFPDEKRGKINAWIDRAHAETAGNDNAPMSDTLVEEMAALLGG